MDNDRGKTVLIDRRERRRIENDRDPARGHDIRGNATDEDLQGFLGYVRAYPGNYVGRNLKVSETFATWIVYGAPEV